MNFIKNKWKYIVVAIIALVIGAGTGPSQDEFDQAVKEKQQMTKKYQEASKDLDKQITENVALQEKVDEAAPFFKLKEQERKEKAAEAKAKEEAAKKKAAEEKARKKAEAKRKAAEERARAEAKEKQGYETGITYDQLARTPDKFMDEKVKFTGTVVQVMEGDDTTQIRLAVNDNYDTILFAEFDPSIIDARVLEDDTITIMGTSAGVISYDSTLGGKISIPGVAIDKIEQ